MGVFPHPFSPLPGVLKTVTNALSSRENGDAINRREEEYPIEVAMSLNPSWPHILHIALASPRVAF